MQRKYLCGYGFKQVKRKVRFREKKSSQCEKSRFYITEVPAYKVSPARHWKGFT